MPTKKNRAEYFREYRKRKRGAKEKGKEITDGFNTEKIGTEKVDVSEAKSAYEMLQDMRWVYKYTGNKRRLRSLVKDDDKQFIFMVKELMRIETALYAAKIRKEGDSSGGGSQSVFVVLKGLEDAPSVQVSVNKDIDIRQIEHALNPNSDLVPFEAEERKQDSPEEIIKILDKVESDPKMEGEDDGD